MAKEKEQLRWQGRGILKKDDGFDLDRSAAVYEFKHKLDRKKAEDMAYGDYRKNQSIDGAAYHLAGMKAAHAVGAKEDAIKHSIAYGLHMKHLGLDPVSEPPDEIKSRMDKHSKVYKFSPHDSDTLFVDNDMKKSESLEKDEFQHLGNHGEYRIEGRNRQVRSASKPYPILSGVVRAVDSAGNVVGNVEFGSHKFHDPDFSSPHIHATMVSVDPEHQRKGIATAMYQHAEKMTGKKWAQAPLHTEAGRAFVQKLGIPKVPFE